MSTLSKPDTRAHVLRLTVAVAGTIVLVGFNARGLAHVPEFGLPSSFIFPGNDLVVYLEAGQAVANGESPYVTEPWTDPAVYHYSPTVAWITALVLGRTTGFDENLPFRALAYLDLALIVALLPLSWLLWRRALSAAQPGAAAIMLLWLPVWIVYSQWFADQNYLNIYTALMALSGALTLAVLRRRTGLAVALAAVIVQTKPQYAFPLALPLLLGQWRYCARLWLGTVAACAAIAVATMALAGLPFGPALYRDYLIFLTSIPENYPWSSYYLGYNHSWYSILHWVFGMQPWTPTAVTLLKIITFLPVGWLCARQIRRADAARPALALGALLALHLWSMTLLDQLWEVSLAIVAMMFLLASDAPRVRRLAILIGAPFALLGFIQLAGWRMAPLLGTSPDQLDITARLPVMMATALGLCALLVWSVGRAAPQLPTYGGGIPGRGVEVRPGEGSIVLTGDGAMLLKQVQPEGGEPCSASEALDRLGYTLTG